MTYPEIEAVLLFDRVPRLEHDACLEPINAALADLAISFSLREREGETSLLLRSTTMELRIEACLVPMPPAVFAQGLSAARMRAASEARLRDAVQRHRATLSLRLERAGARRVAPDLAAMVLARVLRVACAMSEPAAVYWAQSGMLFTPHEIAAMDARRFPARLVFRPEAVEPGSDDTAPGLRAVHSELYCGRQLVIPPGRMGTAEALAAIERIIEAHVTRATALARGVTLPHSDKVQFRVILDDDWCTCPTGCFVLEPEAAGTRRKTSDSGSDLRLPGHGAPGKRRPASAPSAAEQRSGALRTWALCAALATISPLAAAALFLWNLLRGPNLAVSVVASALILATFTGLLLVELLGFGNSEIASGALRAMGSPFHPRG
jgi:hypothetical protein